MKNKRYDIDDKSFYDKTMEQLEREQKKLRDNYNTLDEEINRNYYSKRLRSLGSLRYAMGQDEKFQDYIVRLKAYFEVESQQNYDRHKNWYTHTGDPRGCCFCDPNTMVAYCIMLLSDIAKKYPDYNLHTTP